MMTRHTPIISIGLPVYNGENFLAQAIDSLLAQTFTDFELILSDNGSTDRTAEICREYARRDPRVWYTRAEKNQGAAWNFNHVVELASGQYFKWAAHDDLMDPTFLARCVSELEANPDVVLVYPLTAVIDSKGKIIEYYDVRLRTDHPNASVRFRDLLIEWHLCYEIFGLIRTDLLRQTPLIGNYGHGDGILLERLALLGRFVEIPEVLFYARRHPLQSMDMFGVFKKGHNNYHLYTLWFDPSKTGRIILPTWRMLAEHARTLAGAPFSLREKLALAPVLFRWICRRRGPLVYDLVIAARALVRRPSSPLQKSTAAERS